MRLARRAAFEAEEDWKKSRRTLLVQQQNIDELQKNINRAQQRINTLQEQRENVREQLESARREAAILKERRQAIHLQLEDIDLELPLLQEQHNAASEQLASATEDLLVSQKQLEENRHHLHYFRQSFQGQQAEIKTWQNKLATIEKKRSFLFTHLAQAEGQLSQLQKRVQEHESDSNGDINEQIVRLQVEQDRQTAVLTSTQDNVETLRQQRDRLQDQRRNLANELKQNKQKAKKQQKVLRRQRDQLARLETKVDLLGQLRQSEITVDKDVSLVGSLASLIEIPVEYKRAIEAALTSRMATLVVKDSVSMWKLVGSKHRQAIHVAALADIQPPTSHSAPNDSGVIGWANELVTSQQQNQAVVNLLLGPVLLVKKRETVYRLASSLPLGTLAVSADGFVAYAGGLVEIGGSSGTDGVLSRETAWREAKKGLEKAQLEVEQNNTAVSRLQDTIQQQQDQIDHLLNEDRRFGHQENEAIQKVSVAQRRVDHSGQQITYLQRQKERQTNEINRLHGQIQIVKTKIYDDQDTGQSLDRELVEAKVKLETLPVAEAQQQEQGLSQRITAAETIVAGRLAVVDSRRTTLKQVERQLSRLKQRQHVLISQQESLAKKETAVSQQQLHDQRSELEAMIKPIQSRLIENQDELMSIQQKTGDVQRQAHEKETLYTQTQVRFTQQESQIETLQERIHTDLGLVALRFDKDQTGPTPLPISEVVEQLPSVDELPSGIEKSIQQFRGQLQRMGGINPDAPVEYEETQARFEFMTQQVEDRNLTETQLRQVISELDELTSRAFAETVEKVNDVFGDTFTQLFGGGSARLVLTDPDDLTISGVDIIARLPNRREQGLGLLSGGERSLTASALIFSLLKVSPTPFCVMDEVDAALDEANINRFRDILHELSLKTQFIVITHNRGTVQAAQTIYGVSMQPDSASQVISIRPEEYVRQELI
jgi:chromosome segregation protein